MLHAVLAGSQLPVLHADSQRLTAGGVSPEAASLHLSRNKPGLNEPPTV
jgi:hypothetical protein